MTQVTAPPTPSTAFAADRHQKPRTLSRALDFLLIACTTGGAAAMAGLLLLLIIALVAGALPAIKAFGFKFMFTSGWDPLGGQFGGWPMIYGTLVSSLIGILLAVPLSVGAAVFLVRLAPRWLVAPASFLIELLAAIPSITYGFWGIYVLVPFMRIFGTDVLKPVFGHIPLVGYLFVGHANGTGMLTAGVVLSVMIIPIITAVTRDVLRAVPKELEQGAYGLGATWWQATQVVLSYAKVGIFGAVILGLARALGETMAVTMVIGGNPEQVTTSLFGPGETIASILANQYRDSASEFQTQTLTYLALALLAITLVINFTARLLVSRVAGPQTRI